MTTNVAIATGITAIIGIAGIIWAIDEFWPGSGKNNPGSNQAQQQASNAATVTAAAKIAQSVQNAMQSDPFINSSAYSNPSGNSPAPTTSFSTYGSQSGIFVPGGIESDVDELAPPSVDTSLDMY